MQNKQAGQSTLLQTDAWQKRGVIEEIRVKAILLSLCEALRAAHREGKVFGHVSPQHIMVDDSGGLSLDWAVHGAVSDADQLFGVLPDGYAAFEQYMDESGWQIGPWTDVYGLSALVYALVVGQAPSNAVARMVDRSEVTFDSHTEAQFGASFLAAVARGLSLDRRVRHQSVDEFALGIGAAAISGILMAENTSAPATEATTGAGRDPAVASIADINELTFGRPHAEAVSPFRWQVPVTLAVAAAIGIGAWQAVGGHDGDATNAVTGGHVAVSTPAGSDRETDTRPDAAFAPIPVITDEPGTAVSDASGVNPTANLPPDTAIVSMPDLSFGVPGARTSDSVTDVSAIFPANDPVKKTVPAAAQGSSASTPAEAVDPNLPVIVESHEARSTGVLPNGHAKVASSSEELPKRQAESKARSVKVQVDIRPWGEVFVNGASRGVSPPLRSLTLPPGAYQVRIVNGDLPVRQLQLTVKEGASASIAHKFSADGE